MDRYIYEVDADEADDDEDAAGFHAQPSEGKKSFYKSFFVLYFNK